MVCHSVDGWGSAGWYVIWSSCVVGCVYEVVGLGGEID